MAYDAARARDLRLRRQYGITSEEYDLILAHQNGVCAVCGKPPKEGQNLNIDHAHDTGLVRGVLCWTCNRRVIANHTEPRLLLNAADYLEYPPAVRAIGMKYGRTGRVTKKRRRKSTKSTKRRS